MCNRILIVPHFAPETLHDGFINFAEKSNLQLS
jgi:hypothetical protein